MKKFLIILGLVVGLSGCGPTIPYEKVREFENFCLERGMAFEVVGGQSGVINMWCIRNEGRTKINYTMTDMGFFIEGINK